LLLEHPEYVEKKSRGGRFLPLSVGLSMWAHHRDTGFIGLVPRNQNNMPESEFYQRVHDETGAKFHFASSNDPHHHSKIHRGQIAHFCTIPTLDAPSTTERTQKLTPYKDFEWD